MVLQAKQVRANMASKDVPEFEMRHRLGLALEFADLSVSDMANELHLSRTTVSNYLHGRTSPRRSDLIVWAMTCKVPLDWIVDGIVVTPESVTVIEAKQTPSRTRKAANRKTG